MKEAMNKNGWWFCVAFVCLFFLETACGAGTEFPLVDSTPPSVVGAALHREQSNAQPGPLPVFRFPEAATFATKIAASGDLADVYYPVADDFGLTSRFVFPSSF
jgi:hypothetical protein